MTEPKNEQAELPHEGRLKVAVRTEGDDVNVYLATLDGKQRILVASAATAMIALDKELALKWRDVSIALAMRAIEAGTGTTITSTETFRPEDLESEPQA